MIPKIIHYSWFSGEPFPKFLEECMSTWRKVLPDYEFRLWDGPALAAIGNTFANEAVAEHKWAFAADFLRLYAVYHYGGIWLDTDIEMFKSFDPFLNDGVFIGREYYVHNDKDGEHVNVTSHCFGAEPNNEFIGQCLEYYEHRHFIRSTNSNLPQHLRYDMTIIPVVQAELMRNYGYDWDARKNEKQVLSNGIHVYPYQWFDQPGYTSMDNVVCIHRVAQSWNPKSKQLTPREVTNVKKKTLSYYKMKTQEAIIRFIKEI